MKTPLSNSPQQNNKSRNYQSRPDVRNNPDSRANEEQDFKADDVTHTTKPHNNTKNDKRS